MILGALAVMVPLLMNMYAKVGYLSYRHMMFLAALLAPLGGGGAVITTGLIVMAIKQIRAPRALRAALPTVIIAALAVAMGFHTLRPLHGGKLYVRRAGRFVAEAMKEGDYLLADQEWVLHYAQVPGERFWLGSRDAEMLLSMIRQSQATHMALSDSYIHQISPDLPSKLVAPEFVEIRTFVQPRSKRPDAIRVYRINRGAAKPSTAPAGPGQ